jgi:hypothetical protein
MRAKKSNRGSEIITTPIIIAIGIMLVSTLIVFSVNILTPYIFYEKLSSACIKYVFIMEDYGYLTSKEQTNLQVDLISQGFDINKLKIECTNKRQKYGSPIYLKATYLYELDLPIIGKSIIPMVISRESVSKI